MSDLDKINSIFNAKIDSIKSKDELQNYVPEINKTTAMIREIQLFSNEQNSALKSICLEMDQLSELAQRGIQNLPSLNTFVPN